MQKSDVGTTGEWETRDGVIRGRMVGWSSSRRIGHTSHDGPYAVRKSDCKHPTHTDAGCAQCRCSACRWSDFALISVGSKYVLCLIGRSAVPGESDRFRAEEMDAASDVLEALKTRQRSAIGQRVFFTIPAARLLANAAGRDEGIRDVWENSAGIA